MTTPVIPQVNSQAQLYAADRATVERTCKGLKAELHAHTALLPRAILAKYEPGQRREMLAECIALSDSFIQWFLPWYDRLRVVLTYPVGLKDHYTRANVPEILGNLSVTLTNRLSNVGYALRERAYIRVQQDVVNNFRTLDKQLDRIYLLRSGCRDNMSNQLQWPAYIDEIFDELFDFMLAFERVLSEPTPDDD